MLNSNILRCFSILISFLTIFSFNVVGEERIPITKIEEVKISSPIINPSKGEKCTISYNLSQPSPVTIKIYDENEQLVRTLLNNKKRKAGLNKENWDGKDDRGTILPSEAYSFIIEGDDFIYDPVNFSGGELIGRLNASAKKISPCSISYTLPTSARVRIRLGVKAGPLYRTLVDWQPRPPGSHTEEWDGKDKTGKIDLASHTFCFISVEAFSLPENSIIISGTSLATPKTVKPSKIREIKKDTSSRRLYEHARHPRYRCRDPEVEMTLSQEIPLTEDGLPIINGECSVKVEIEKSAIEWLKEENAEGIFFVDDKFLYEEENISSPYTWHFDSTQYTDGKHLLTVNVRSFSDHCATDCVRIYIRNE